MPFFQTVFMQWGSKYVLDIQNPKHFYPPVSEASREVANLTERKICIPTYRCYKKHAIVWCRERHALSTSQEKDIQYSDLHLHTKHISELSKDTTGV